MESANFHHHQQDDHQLGLSWYQNSILNDNGTRDVKQHIYKNIDLVPMSHDLGILPSNISMENFETHDEQLQHLARIKHELSVTRSYSELPKSSIEDFMSKKYNNLRTRYNNYTTTNQDLLHKNFSNGCQIKNDQLMNHQIPSISEKSISYPNNDSNSGHYYRGSFSQIFPTLNVSNLNQLPSTCDMNLPALDHFNSSPTSNGSCLSYQPSSLNVHHNLEGFFKDNYLSYDHVDQLNNKTSTEAKRPASNYKDYVKAPKATPTKKSKLDLRPSCSPLKIRKEKLGDRISALQQMVAPFGKTDTASVLMEAIGYIKFLQNQVETLSVPYMNSTQMSNRMSTRGGSIKDGNEETKRDLRSRGLCLVPVSCLTYVTYADGNVWGTP